MNDYQTKDIVVWILDKMGYQTLKKDAMEGNNIELYINYIKHKSKYYKNLQQSINYFL